MDPKKKNDKKTTLFVIGGLVILLSATAFFVFRTPKSQAYRETRVVSMDEKSTPAPTKEPIQVEEDEEFVEPGTMVDTAYMTVTVPGFSTEDVKKKNAEDKDKEKTKTTKSTKTTKTVTTTQTTGQPAIVDHYYVDETGKQVEKPDENSDTVYVIEYDKKNQPTQNEFSDVISDYLKGDTTYVADNAKAAASLSDDSLVVMGATGSTGGSTGTGSNNNNTGKSTSKSNDDDTMIVQGATETVQDGESLIIDPEKNTENTDDTENAETGEDDLIDQEPKNDEKEVIMELIDGPVSEEDRPSVVRVVEDGFTIDPATQELGRYGVQASWNLNQNEGHDGVITASLFGLNKDYVKSLVYQCDIIAGSGYIQDTDDDFTKLVHVEDGSAIQFVVTAVYVDDSVKTSEITTVAHKDYSPLNSNQVTMVEE